MEVMRKMADASVDAIVTDPPYGLRFMGKRWDYDVPSVEIWAECLRVLKPGGHLLAFAATRTQHRMAVRIEDAGFEIRDLVMWHYGSGFPKSMDVSKAIDRAAGALAPEGKNFRTDGGIGTASYRPTINPRDYVPPAPATPEARQWAGWGTALKPATEIVTVARKPLEGTVAANVLQWGTGGINVDGCRIGSESTTTIRSGNSGANGRYGKDNRVFTRENPPGRWPANLIHDGSDEVVGLFPSSQSGFHGAAGQESCHAPRGAESGSAARFFYCAKAAKNERGEGNAHPTVKPIALMRYLCRLVTPPNGLVLDPFAGTGTTGLAAREEGFRFVGIEMDAQTCETARKRLK